MKTLRGVERLKESRGRMLEGRLQVEEIQKLSAGEF